MPAPADAKFLAESEANVSAAGRAPIDRPLLGRHLSTVGGDPYRGLIGNLRAHSCAGYMVRGQLCPGRKQPTGSELPPTPNAEKARLEP
jgi:hypothetical protein